MSLTREEARLVAEVSLKRAKEGKPSIVREILERRAGDEFPAPYYVNGCPVFHLKPSVRLDGETDQEDKSNYSPSHSMKKTESFSRRALLYFERLFLGD